MNSILTNRTTLQILGSFEILISLYWSWHNAYVFYRYWAYPDILWAFMLPDWFLISQFLAGLLGIWCGIQVFRARYSILKGYSLFFLSVLAIESLYFI